MAATKKYAGLPDLDAAPEIYETPELTDDASTVPTGTLRTDSPAPSEDTNENLDRSQFNREEARRKFEPAIVDAKDVNFSYAVGGNQRSYSTRHRRRRRIRQAKDGEVLGDLSSESDVDEEETLGQKLARLRREAEEIRLEIERREREEGEFKDTVEHQRGTNSEENDIALSRGVDELGRVLDSLQSSNRAQDQILEGRLARQPEVEASTKPQPVPIANGKPSQGDSSMSTIAAITTFSDRLTALESALGLSAVSPSSTNLAVLPTLDTLTSQISMLHSTISPPQVTSTISQANSSNLTPQMPHLDILQSRLHTLHQSATSLLNARKQAQTALQDLENVRLRGKMTSDHLTRYQTLAIRRAGRPTSSSSPLEADHDGDDSRPTSRSGAPVRRLNMADDAQAKVEIADEIITPLFLEEQAEKIKALYNVLPTIQNLQPLLPLVLDRLRGLSVVHANAAGARADMDEVEERLRDWEGEMAKWKDAVIGVEKGIEEAKVVMKENAEVLGGQVRGVEDRLEKLEGGRR